MISAASSCVDAIVPAKLEVTTSPLGCRRALADRGNVKTWTLRLGRLLSLRQTLTHARMIFVVIPWNLPSPGDFVHRENANPSIFTQERVSEIDLMSAIYPLSVHRRIERQWAERINSLRQIHGEIIVGTERTLQRVFNNDGSLIPVPVRAVVDPRQLDQSRPHD
jgi:hypothetical protein